MVKSKTFYKRLISEAFDKLHPVDGYIKNKYIFALHRVLPREYTKEKYVQSSMFITPETLESLIKWAKRIGCISTLEELLSSRDKNAACFAFTFDDGWKDNYEHAFPILKRNHVPATIFLSTDAINTGKLFWPEDFLEKADVVIKSGKEDIVREAIPRKGSVDIYSLLDSYIEELKLLTKVKRQEKLNEFFEHIGVDKERKTSSILSWRQINEMKKYGISFGSHTHTHAILEYHDDEEIYQELKLSKAIIEEKIGCPCNFFSYPNARYRTGNEKIISRFYEWALRIHNLPVRATDSPFMVPRVMINERVCSSLSFMKFRLLGVPSY